MSRFLAVEIASKHPIRLRPEEPREACPGNADLRIGLTGDGILGRLAFAPRSP
jgi:hypothetical protein